MSSKEHENAESTPGSASSPAGQETSPVGGSLTSSTAGQDATPQATASTPTANTTSAAATLATQEKPTTGSVRQHIDELPEERVAQSTAPARGMGRRPWIAVAFATFVIAWGGNEFTPLLVFYRKESVFSPVFVDSLLVAYAIGIMVGLVILGPLSDRYGRKIVMLSGPVFAMLGSMLIAIGETIAVPMFIGRMLAGVAVGVGITVGGSWIKELSQAPYEVGAAPTAGASRAAMSATAGFGIGAAIAGCLAQWAPMPGQLSYILQVILSIPALIWLLRVPETRQSAHLKVHGSFWSDVKVPTAKHPRFLLVALPIAPWVFGAAGVAYAVTPALMTSHVHAPIAFSALLTAVCLACGFGIQQVGAKINTTYSARGPIVATALVCVGMVMAAYLSGHLSIWGAVVTAGVLGLGYGLTMISGLIEVQRLAGPDDLAGLTSAFYVLTYIGFFFPMILTKLSGNFSYLDMLGFGVVESLLTIVLLVFVSKKFIPEKSA